MFSIICTFGVMNFTSSLRSTFARKGNSRANDSWQVQGFAVVVELVGAWWAKEELAEWLAAAWLAISVMVAVEVFYFVQLW